MDSFPRRAAGASRVSGPRTEAFDAGEEVHVWLARPAEWVTAESRAGWLALLDADEMARHARFKFERSKDEFLCGRALMRSALGAYTGAYPKDLRIEIAGDGKPRVVTATDAPEGSAIRFNMSHTEGLIALAVARGTELGVDVEFHDPGRATGSIAKRFFSERENAWLSTLSGDAYTRSFFRIWTLKEAYLKARGTGLRLSLGGFFVLPESEALENWGIGFTPGFGDDPARWRLHSAAPDESHSLGLVAERRLTGESTAADDAYPQLRVRVRAVKPGEDQFNRA